MSSLDADAIRSSLGELALRRLERVEAFRAIESTNAYLMQEAAPRPGGFQVAVTANQTAGRGRHGRTWQSPPGSGLCLSVAYTFASRPGDLPALTLAIGLGLVESLEEFGFEGIALKWPNDLVARNAKLGGILTESRLLPGESMHVVTGVGINVDLPDDFDLGAEAVRAQPVVDLSQLAAEVPAGNAIASRLIDGLCDVFVTFESQGFAAYASRWSERDWLRGRALTVDSPQQPVRGVASGIAGDGALLVEIDDGSMQRVTSGTVVLAHPQGVVS